MKFCADDARFADAQFGLSYFDGLEAPKRLNLPVLPRFSFEVDHEYGEIGRTDSADAAGLAKAGWPDATQLLARLGP